MIVCKDYPQYLRMESTATYIIIYCSVELVLSVFIIFLNGNFIIAFIVNKMLHTPSNSILACLCCSDLLIGLVTLIIMVLAFSGVISDIYDAKYIFMFNLFVVVVGISSMFMALVNLDRYVAICHPFKYLQQASVKTYTVTSISACIVYALVITACYIMDGIYTYLHSVILIPMLIVGATGIIIVYCNWKILKVIRRHQREIVSIERNSNRSNVGFQRKTRRYRVIVILSVIFVFCNLPPSVVYFLIILDNTDATSMTLFISMVADVLLLLNSFLNPLVYCFSISQFRTAMKNVFCCQRTE